MSAPAGWHLQPDGQERFWDGTQWTEQFRAPVTIDPTAPPPPPSWADSADSPGPERPHPDVRRLGHPGTATTGCRGTGRVPACG